MSNTRYIPSNIEPKWQEEWENSQIYNTDLDSDKQKFYLVAEFPYPSGDLHIGHWFTFSIPDMVARFKRMQGFNVLYPFGFDAFGLPAENAAIKWGYHPKDWTYKNISAMREQLKLLGATFDWRYSVVSCDPEYYKWNQWIFLKMLEKGLAYKGKYLSNWCPSCQTVLANENVESGKCWRCGTEVIQKEIEQWFLKITDYASELEWPDAPKVDWPKSIREAQNNWIGKSAGVEVNFAVNGLKEVVTVYTTRPDTLFGVSFIAINPEHQLLEKLTTASQKKAVDTYVEKAKKKSELERKENKEKTGVFTGSYAIHPITKEEIPVWIGDYVLPGYGTGAVMGVPAHDERDLDFAIKNNLEVKPVIEPLFIQSTEPGGYKKNEPTVPREGIIAIVKHWSEDKYLNLKWKQVAWQTLLTGGIEEGQTPEIAAIEEVKQETGYQHPKVIKHLGTVNGLFYHVPKKENRLAHGHIIYLELEDNTQVPISEEESSKHEFEWLTLDQLEKSLTPDTHQYALRVFQSKKPQVYTDEGILINSGGFTGLSSSEAREKISNYLEINQMGSSKTQYHLHDWSISRQRYWGTPIPIIYCEDCGMLPVPFEDLPVELPYNVEYAPKGKPPLATDEEWLNVKCPKCGKPAKREAETMDTFFDSSWYFLRYLDPHNNEEIFNKNVVNKWAPLDIYFGGAEHTLGHTLYSRFFVKFLKDLGLLNFDEYALKRVNHGVILGPDGARMSKSKGNVVNPDEQVKKYGADAVRLYLAFLGPYDLVAPWDPNGINGVYRFLERIWDLSSKVSDHEFSNQDLNELHRTIKKVTLDIESIKLNTAVASLMEYLNYLSKKGHIGTLSKIEFKTLLQLLAPFAPHITEELWEKMGESFSIHQTSWPDWEDKYLQTATINLVIQVNGKLRENIEVSSDLIEDQSEIEKIVKSNSKIQSWIEGKELKRFIYIPGKLVNLVI